MHWINTILELLSPGWVGTIVGLLGLIAAVVTYLLTRQRIRLAYCYTGKRLLGLATAGLPEGITVHYRGQDIPRLTRTLVVLWNAGEKTILGEDIVAADPLRLKLRGDGRVLAATVLKTKRDVCQIEALPDASCPNEIHIRFDFLDAGDGAVIEILHTSEERAVEFLGTLRGLPQGLYRTGNIITTREKIILRYSQTILIIGIGVLLAKFLMKFPERTILGKTLSEELFISPIILSSSIYILFGIVGIFVTRRRYPKYFYIEELS